MSTEQHPRLIRRVFLAGKITGNDWRQELVRGDLALHPTPGFDCLIGQVCNGGADLAFPLRRHGVLSLLDYVGPYYVCTDEGACDCESEHHAHGVWHADVKRAILEANRKALEICDVVFAWIDDASAVTTVYEIGYAQALGKEVWVAGPCHLPEFHLLYHGTFSDVIDIAGYVGHCDQDAYAAFLRLLTDRLSDPWYGPDWAPASIDPSLLSPIEARFLRAWNAHNPYWKADWNGPVQKRFIGLVPQYPINRGQYRLDFAVTYGGVDGCVRIAIELDGFDSHHTTDQIAHDHRRQREIESLGWKVIRFGGKEVHQNAEGCVIEARRIIEDVIDASYRHAAPAWA